MDNLQQSLVEAEELRRDAYARWLEDRASEHLLDFDANDDDLDWLLEAEERQREYRDEMDTVAKLLQF